MRNKIKDPRRDYGERRKGKKRLAGHSIKRKLIDTRERGTCQKYTPLPSLKSSVKKFSDASVKDLISGNKSDLSFQ